MDNFTNDFRASRVFKVGGGALTDTAGVYKSIQKLDPDNAFNPVRQAEVGLNYRQGNFTVNLTGFYAKTNDLNTQLIAIATMTINQQIIRVYTAKGVELEAGFATGRSA